MPGLYSHQLPQESDTVTLPYHTFEQTFQLIGIVENSLLSIQNNFILRKHLPLSSTDITWFGVWGMGFFFTFLN